MAATKKKSKGVIKHDDFLVVRFQPPDIKRQFKAWCARRNIGMSEIIRAFIQDVITSTGLVTPNGNERISRVLRSARRARRGA